MRRAATLVILPVISMLLRRQDSARLPIHGSKYGYPRVDNHDRKSTFCWKVIRGGSRLGLGRFFEGGTS